MRTAVRRALWTTMLLAALALTQGCVTRELHITSEPTGAEVLINDTYRGVTPMTHRFVHYQVFRIRLEKEGYHPRVVEEPIAAPGYEKPGVDFVSEALVPKQITDRRELHYELEKVEGPDELEPLLQRAAETRESVEEAARRRAERDKEREPVEAPLLPVREKVREAEEPPEETPPAGETETDAETDAAETGPSGGEEDSGDAASEDE
jgi:hypothetical protein